MIRLLLIVAGAVLSTLLGACAPVVYESPFCTTDASCKSGELCISGRCVANTTECSQDSDCDQNQICRGGFCEPMQCATSCDCYIDELCQQGRCLALDFPCSSDSSCSDGLLCLAVNPQERCMRFSCSVPECSNSDDCEGVNICRNGRCGYPRCFWSYNCASNEGCFELDCVDSDCKSDEDCGNDRFACFRKRCTSIPCNVHDDTSCPYGMSCWNDFCHYVGCGSSEPCQEGDVCIFGQCTAPNCQTNSDCLPFERCEGGKCFSIWTIE